MIETFEHFITTYPYWSLTVGMGIVLAVLLLLTRR
jgi:hypothetical protein